jgi:AraC-like DNA-binding protein
MARHTSGIRQAQLEAPSPGVAATLTYYPPALAQPAHHHDQSHASVVLAGEFQEAGSMGRITGRSGDVFQRGESHDHQVTFGRHGALILALSSGTPQTLPQTSPKLGAPRRPAPALEAPMWLLDAREMLSNDPGGLSISGLARRFKVHRVHLSRAFVAHFGVRPSVIRQQAMVDHALALALHQGEPIAACAQMAGFSDQAHFTRALKAVCGLPPARLRRLLSGT